MGCGVEMICCRLDHADVERDCWTRVLSKSAGCRRMDEVKPDAKPASKWKVVLGFRGGGASGSCGCVERGDVLMDASWPWDISRL